MRPVYIAELPTLTPREIALGCCSDETIVQDVTLAIEIRRAEKRLAYTLAVVHAIGHHGRYGKFPL